MAKDEDKRTVNDTIVELLEELTEDARKGLISGIAIVAAHPDIATIPSTFLRGQLSDTATLGALEKIKFHVLRLMG